MKWGNFHLAKNTSFNPWEFQSADFNSSRILSCHSSQPTLFQAKFLGTHLQSVYPPHLEHDEQLYVIVV